MEGNLVCGWPLPRSDNQAGPPRHPPGSPVLAQSCRFYRALPAASVPPSAPLRSISSAYPCSPAPDTPPPAPLPAPSLSTCLAAENTTLWIGGVPCTLRVALAVRGYKEDSTRAPPFCVPAPRVSPAAPRTKHRDVHVDVGHGTLLQLAEELLQVDATTSASRGPPREYPRAPGCRAHSPP